MRVIRDHIKPLPEQEPIHLNLNPTRPLPQHGSHEELDSVDLHRLVLREVLALEVGVDRHLDVAASANRRNKVQRRPTAAVSHQRNRLR